MTASDRLRPLTGFGPIGWALLPIAIALAALLVTGYDLRLELLKLEAALFPSMRVDLLMRWLLLPQWIAVGSRFGLSAVCVVLLAMHLDPRAGPLGIKGTTLAAWGLVAPILFFWSRYLAKMAFGNPDALWMAWPWDWSLAGAAIGVATSVLLGWAFRSWLVAGTSLAAQIAVSWFFSLFTVTSWPGWSDYLPWWFFDFCYEISLLAALLPIALVHRRRFVPEGHCACGYDLADAVPGATCPECGASNP